MPYKSKEVRGKWIHAHRERNRAFVLRVKRILGCMDCGYSSHPAALVFDHRPGEHKRKNVMSLLYQSRRELKAEMRKCDLVCANCHYIREFNRKLR